MPVDANIELILGTAQLVTTYGVTRGGEIPATHQSAKEFLRNAYDKQVFTLDTAPAYGDAEKVIGESGIPFKIHTKLRRGVNALDSLEASKVNLQAENIEVVYIHDIDAFRSDSKKMINDLSKILDHGVRHIGVSIYDEADLALVREFNQVTFVQVPMNVFDRRFSGAKVQEMNSSGLSVVVRSAFLQGVLLADSATLRPEVMHLKDFVDRFQSEAQKLDVDPVTACLHWVMSQARLSGVIVGAQNKGEFDVIRGSWEKARKLPFDDSWAEVIPLPNSVAIDPRKWSAL
jgi:aryl-alcohol dehydrogenase-like predicted oxidoreductase